MEILLSIHKEQIVELFFKYNGQVDFLDKFLSELKKREENELNWDLSVEDYVDKSMSREMKGRPEKKKLADIMSEGRERRGEGDNWDWRTKSYKH